jgi:hypothetical protein
MVSLLFFGFSELRALLAGRRDRAEAGQSVA